jgi:hypothetical protein
MTRMLRRGRRGQDRKRDSAGGEKHLRFHLNISN